MAGLAEISLVDFSALFSEPDERQLKGNSMEMLLSVKKVFNWLTRPKSRNKDFARREFILNVLLVGAIFLSSAAILSAWIGTQRVAQKGEIYQGVPIALLATVPLSFLALYFFSRGGKPKLVAYIFISLYIFSAMYTSYYWGTSVPQALLIFALVIVMTGVLIGTKFAFVVTIFISLSLFAISYLHTKRIILANTAWRSKPPHLRDTGVSIMIFAIIAIVSWLFNREIEKALQRARRSEKALKKERDFLEVRVEERTKELKKAQLEKVLHLYRLADFGRMAAGFFHDLVTPLTTVSLNVERLQARSKDVKQLNSNMGPLLKRAASGTRRMKSFVQAVRKQIQKQEEKVVFSLNREIIQSLDVLNYKAKSIRVKLHFVYPKTIRTYGNPLRFNQLITNLVSNAIEAYEGVRRRKNREVIIKLARQNKRVILEVQDFGCGIPKKNLGKIFDPFFTTKSAEKGTGIGLSICKDIAKEEFGGKIKVESKQGKGTTVIAEFPIRKI